MKLSEKLVKLGWTDSAGRSLQWFDHQRRNHDEQFEVPRERKVGPKKFTKEKN